MKRNYFKFLALMLSFLVLVCSSVYVRATEVGEKDPPQVNPKWLLGGPIEPVTTTEGDRRLASKSAAEAYYKYAAFMREEYDVIVLIKDTYMPTLETDFSVAPDMLRDEDTFSAFDVCIRLDNTLYDNVESLGEKSDILIKMHENLEQFGFILRYPKGKERITGHDYDPFHIRFVGSQDSAKKINEYGSLEEYLGR